LAYGALPPDQAGAVTSWRAAQDGPRPHFICSETGIDREPGGVNTNVGAPTRRPRTKKAGPSAGLSRVKQLLIRR